MARSISVADADGLLSSSAEFAFLDVRDVVPFGAGHPFLAAHAPCARIELSVPLTSPRRSTPILLTDGEGELAPIAAARLESLGYNNVSVLAGGARVWAESGRALFPELEVPSKGFGAFARIHGQPNFISPAELASAIDNKADLVVLDSRPMDEYSRGNIPGSIDAPGADVLRWFDDLVPNANTTVVVNCMSATRGILGGLSLKAAGVPNEVRVLHHGTRGWLLDGLKLETGATRVPAALSATASANARRRAQSLRQRAGLTTVNAASLAHWRAEADRTTFVIDVRSTAEFASGHLGGSVNASEGRIVMAPEHYFTTRNARIVLVDDDTVRASVTALWLAQMGWGEVVVFDDDLLACDLEVGDGAPGTEPASDGAPVPNSIDPPELQTLLDNASTQVIDIGHSDAYCAAHLPGASWCLRADLPAVVASMPTSACIVLTCEDGRLAALATGDINTDDARDIRALRGGTNGWLSAGKPTATGPEQLCSPLDDHWLASSERPGDLTTNVLAYLDWETTLLDDINGAGLNPYRNAIWPA